MTSTHFREDLKNSEPSHIPGGIVKWWENNLAVPQKVKGRIII